MADHNTGICKECKERIAFIKLDHLCKECWKKKKVTEDPLWQERQRLFLHLKAVLDAFYHKNKLDEKGLTMDLTDEAIGNLAWSLIDKKDDDDKNKAV